MAGYNPAEMMSRKNFEKYKGKWVVVPSWHRINQILASGENLDDIQKKIAGKKYFNAVIFFVENENQGAQ